MFGYFFSNSLISTCRMSSPPAAIGLADHAILPEVAEPVGDGRGRCLAAPPPLLLPPLLAAGQGDRPGRPDDGSQLLSP